MIKRYLSERIEMYILYTGLILAFTLILMLIMFIVYRVHFILYIFLLIPSLGFMLSIYFYIFYISKPFKNCEKRLKSYCLGHDSKAFCDLPVYYSDNIERTITKFEGLLDSINAIKLSNAHAEYRALQNQINPHFLYNTLEAIRSDAIAMGVEDIANITESLAKFFRYTISNVNSLVTLEEEIINAENYFKVQNYRFGDKIRLIIHTSDDETDFMKLKIPKLTLQPIIENAIVHGLENKIGDGKIDIEFVITTDRLLITITDDGVGMEPDVLDNINSKLATIHMDADTTEKPQMGGVALINVNNRLKMQYGEKYGLLLFSIPSYGTRVEIICPINGNVL